MIRMNVIFYILFFACVTSMSAQNTGQDNHSKESHLGQMSDAELVAQLSKDDGPTQTAFDLGMSRPYALEIFNRGERMIPLLLTLENNKRLYRSGGLTLNISSQALPDEVSVEVVGIYLICAIYIGKMPFANAPALVNTDSTTAPHLLGNSDGTVHRAWEAIRIWNESLKFKGLNELRKVGRGPLTGSGVTFY